MTDPLDPLVWTTTEAGRLLSMSRWTIRRLVDEGQLSAIQIGRRLLIPKVALTEFIEQHTTKGAA